MVFIRGYFLPEGIQIIGGHPFFIAVPYRSDGVVGTHTCGKAGHDPAGNSCGPAHLCRQIGKPFADRTLQVEGVYRRNISGCLSLQHAVVIENVVDDPGVNGHQPLQIGGVIGHDGVGLRLYHGVYGVGRTIQRLGGGGTAAVLGKDLPVQLAEIHLPVIIDAQMLVEVFLDLLHAVLCRKAIIFGGIADDANNGQGYRLGSQLLPHPIGNRILIHIDSVHVQIIILHPAFHRQTACSAVGTGGAVKHGHKRLVCIVGRRHGAGIAFDPMGIVNKSRIRP